MYFIESSHKYYKNFPEENLKYISASAVSKRYSQDFDDEYWSLYKAYEFILYKNNVDPSLHIDDYLLNKPDEPKQYFKSYKRGYKPGEYKLFKHLRMYANEIEALKVQKYILKSWEIKNTNSKFKGGDYHYEKEMDSLDKDYLINPYTNNKVPVINCNEWVTSDTKRRIVDLKDLKPGYYTEIIIDHGLFLGQADIVWIDYVNNELCFWVEDYKTNEKIDLTNPFQKLNYPLNHLDDCNYNHYRIQLGIYSYILEQYGYKCMGNTIIHCIHDEISDTWSHVNYNFEYIKNEINEIVMDIVMDI